MWLLIDPLETYRQGRATYQELLSKNDEEAE